MSWISWIYPWKNVNILDSKNTKGCYYGSPCWAKWMNFWKDLRMDNQKHEFTSVGDAENIGEGGG